MGHKNTLTTASGMPVRHDDISRTVGASGPLSAENLQLFEKLAHFNRERIPERVVHARGSGAYGTFAATERVLMAAVKAGADRQEMHEIIRQHSLAAWAEITAGHPNPLPVRLPVDEKVTRYLTPEQVMALLDASQYVGDAPVRAKNLAKRIRAVTDQLTT